MMWEFLAGFVFPYLSIRDLNHLHQRLFSIYFKIQVKIYSGFVEGNSTLSGYKNRKHWRPKIFNYHQKELLISFDPIAKPTNIEL